MSRLVKLGRAAALTASCLAAACADGGTGDGAPVADGVARHVLLISLDTLRADHCGLYGYDRPTTPFLDSLAERAVVFEDHMVNSNNTLQSHASILTGLLPAAHGTFDEGEEGKRKPLGPAFVTVAERFRAAGFATAAFAAHPIWLSSSFGLDQGFERFDTAWRRAPSATGGFLDWLDTERPERFFGFLHYYDIHSERGDTGPTPYDSTPELIARFAGEAPEGFTGCIQARPDWCASTYLRAISGGFEELPEAHREYIVGLYDAGIALMDRFLAELFAGLEQRGLLDDTLVVITSDHGEEFMEHGKLLHSGWHDEIMRVPLVVVPPPALGAIPRRANVTTRSIDLAPTLLELAGLEPVGQGVSLRDEIVEGAGVTVPETWFQGVLLRSRDEVSSYKYFFVPGDEAFYDLDADPDESVNLLHDGEFVARNRDRLERIRARFESIRVESEELLRMLESGGTGKLDLDPEERQELEDLGYF